MTEEQFQIAAGHVRGMSSLDESAMLKLYGLYKQATIGPCNTSKPGFWDIVGKSKWDSWKKLGNMDKKAAKINYVKLVQELDPEWDIKNPSTLVDESSAKTQNGMGVSVSTMSYEEDEYISDEDKTIFDWCKEGNVKRVSKMLSNGDTNINNKDENGMTLLHWSGDRGYPDMVEFLLENKANVNAQDDELQTPLHYAAVCEHTAVIKLLLNGGADPRLKDDADVTPMEAAPSELIKDLIKEFSNAK